MVIHRAELRNLADYRKQPEKWLSVAWEATHGRLFTSEIQLDDQQPGGVLAAVASGIASTETNIDQVSLEERDSDTAMLTFELRVRDRRHLARWCASSAACPTLRASSAPSRRTHAAGA